MQDTNDDIISEVRTFVLDQAYYNDLRYLVFANSLSGWDTLRLTGTKTDTQNYTRTGFRRIEQANFTPADGVESQTAFAQREVLANTGFVSSELKNYLQDLLLSKKVFEISSRNPLPVIVNVTNEATESQSNAFLKEETIAYRESLTARHYERFRKITQQVGFFDDYFDSYFD
jgi:hypothetical protein